MRKEVKIGICAVVLLGAFWMGFRFLSGLDLLGRSNEYTIHYESVSGLQGDAAVEICGVKVGQVSEIKLDKGGNGVGAETAEQGNTLVICHIRADTGIQSHGADV